MRDVVEMQLARDGYLRLRESDAFDSAGLDAIAKVESGDAMHRRWDARRREAACRPGADAISDKVVSSTGKEGAQGRIAPFAVILRNFQNDLPTGFGPRITRFRGRHRRKIYFSNRMSRQEVELFRF